MSEVESAGTESMRYAGLLGRYTLIVSRSTIPLSAPPKQSVLSCGDFLPIKCICLMNNHEVSTHTFAVTLGLLEVKKKKKKKR